jgi:hypothetical protein
MKTTNPKDYLGLLDVFSIALTNGLIDKSDVIKWADNIIQKDIDPDPFIIDLSLCGHKSINDIISLINEYVGLERPQVSGRVILGFLHKQYLGGQITLQKVAHSLNWVVWQTDLTEAEKSLMYGLEEDYDLAVDNIMGTVEGMEKEILRVIEIYKDFNIDNFIDWPAINKDIDNKIQELTLIISKEQSTIRQSLQSTKKWWKFW